MEKQSNIWINGSYSLFKKRTGLSKYLCILYEEKNVRDVYEKFEKYKENTENTNFVKILCEVMKERKNLSLNEAEKQITDTLEKEFVLTDTLEIFYKKYLEFIKENKYEIQFYISYKNYAKYYLFKYLIQKIKQEIKIKFFKKKELTFDNLMLLVSHKDDFKKLNNSDYIKFYFSSLNYPIEKKIIQEKYANEYNLEISAISQIFSSFKLYQNKNSLKKIGYFFGVKKHDDFQKKCVLESKEPLLFVPIDPRLDLSIIKSKNIIALFQKISDMEKEFPELYVTMTQHIEKLFQDKEILFIDSIENRLLAENRFLFTETFNKIFKNNTFIEGLRKVVKEEENFQVNCPKFIIINEENQGKTKELVSENKMKFPLMFKFEQACGKIETHYIGIAFNDEGRKELVESLFK